MAKFKASDSPEYAVMRLLNSCPDGLINHSVREATCALLEGDTSLYLSLGMLEYARSDNVGTSSCSYLVQSLLSKWKGLPTGKNLKREAIKSWVGFERVCAATNARLKEHRTIGYPDSVREIISIAQRKISDVLGEYSEHRTSCLRRWSSGATALTKRVPLAEKMSLPIAVTRRASPHLARDVASDPTWLSHLLGVRVEGPVSPLIRLFEYVEEERFLTVPKNAKTDRSIQAAPAGNAFLQQGVGRYIRERLKRFGVDLDDQSVNHRRAQVAQRDGLATLDLRGASDTVSRELVWLLLPQLWAAHLDDLRVGFTRVKGQLIRLQKFSAMGNAFTFELESLIFWAIGYAVHATAGRPTSSLSVYGDDIITEQSVSARFIEVLNYFGFETNSSKSFVAGNFFESCGGHFCHGCDITPSYQKEIVRSLDEAMRFHNRLVRWRIRNKDIVDHVFLTLVERACKYLREFSSRWYRQQPRLPLHAEGDDGFLVDSLKCKPKCVDVHKGMKLLVYTFLGASRPEDRQVAVLAYKLRRPYHTYTYSRGNMVVDTGSGKFAWRYRWVNHSTTWGS